MKRGIDALVALDVGKNTLCRGLSFFEETLGKSFSSMWPVINSDFSSRSEYERCIRDLARRSWINFFGDDLIEAYHWKIPVGEGTNDTPYKIIGHMNIKAFNQNIKELNVDNHMFVTYGDPYHKLHFVTSGRITSDFHKYECWHMLLAFSSYRNCARELSSILS